MTGENGRFVSRAAKELRREMLVSPAPELGLVAANGPNDPEPELVIEGGVVTRMDGRAAADFDVIDRFVVAHGLDHDIAPGPCLCRTKRSRGCSSMSMSPAPSSSAWHAG